MYRVGEPACATADRPRPGVVCWALTGFGLGVVSAAVYLLLGGEYFWGIPRWVALVFYPGFIRNSGGLFTQHPSYWADLFRKHGLAEDAQADGLRPAHPLNPPP
jgi:hypothetical protein